MLSDVMALISYSKDIEYIDNPLILLAMFVTAVFLFTVIFPHVEKMLQLTFFRNLKEKLPQNVTVKATEKEFLKEEGFNIILNENSPLTNIYVMVHKTTKSIVGENIVGVLGSYNFNIIYSLQIIPKDVISEIKGQVFEYPSPIGDPVIDEKFFIFTNDLELTWTILMDKALREYLLNSEFLVIRAADKPLSPSYPHIIIPEPMNEAQDYVREFNILVETKFNLEHASNAFFIVKRFSKALQASLTQLNRQQRQHK